MSTIVVFFPKQRILHLFGLFGLGRGSPPGITFVCKKASFGVAALVLKDRKVVCR